MTALPIDSLIDRIGIDRQRLRRHLDRGFGAADDGERVCVFRL